MNSIFKKRPQIAVFLIGVILIAAGIMQGDYYDTLLKAITVCLECIGIG